MEMIIENKIEVVTIDQPQYPMDVIGQPNAVWKSTFTSQGDCIVKRCGNFGVSEKEYMDIPKDAEMIQGNLVLKGDTNSHALYFGEFQLYKKDSTIFIDVKTPTILDHVKDHKFQVRAEHHAQWLPVGKYFIDPLLEYDHLLEESRRVID
jgi:hypothetical protein